MLICCTSCASDGFSSSMPMLRSFRLRFWHPAAKFCNWLMPPVYSLQKYFVNFFLWGVLLTSSSICILYVFLSPSLAHSNAWIMGRQYSSRDIGKIESQSILYKYGFHIALQFTDTIFQCSAKTVWLTVAQSRDGFISWMIMRMHVVNDKMLTVLFTVTPVLLTRPSQRCFVSTTATTLSTACGKNLIFTRFSLFSVALTTEEKPKNYFFWRQLQTIQKFERINFAVSICVCE